MFAVDGFSNKVAFHCLSRHSISPSYYDSPRSTLIMLAVPKNNDDDRQAQVQYIKELFGMIFTIFLVGIVWTFLLLSCRADCFEKKTKNHDDDNARNDQENNDRNDDDDDNLSNMAVNGAMATTTTTPKEKSNCYRTSPKCRRMMIIRILFIFFGLLLVVSSALFHTKTYSPIVNATDSITYHLLVDVRFVMSKIEKVLKVVHQTLEAVQEIQNDLEMINVPLPPPEGLLLCPDLSAEELANELEVDPQEFVLFLDRSVEGFEDVAGDVMVQLQDSTTEINDIIWNVESVIQLSQDQLWVLPLLTLSATILTTVTLLAVVWAMIQEQRPVSFYYAMSQIRFEQFLGWIILPIFALLTLSLWVVGSAFWLGAIAMSDICLPSPAVTIDYILQESRRGAGIDMDSTSIVGQSISTYMSVRSCAMCCRLSVLVSTAGDRHALDLIILLATGCDNGNPAEMILTIEEALRNYVDLFTERLEKAMLDSFERLESMCGPDNKLDVLFSGMGRLQYHLTNVYNAIAESRKVMECNHIHGLYTEIAEDAICTELGSAIADGLALMTIIAVSGMILITLRIAWRCNL
eukprot:scaffold18384_cov109-Cylindrotheca_fusiformis.AAC.1